MVETGTKKKWSTEELVKALYDIAENKLSFREDEAKSCIPKSTLCDYKAGKVEVGARCGPRPILTAAEEHRSYIPGKRKPVP